MSTKTTLKRIALVAVSALGFGLMSAVPSKAVDVAISVADSITATAIAPRVGDSAPITVTITDTGAALDATDTVTIGARFLTDGGKPTGSAANLPIAVGGGGASNNSDAAAITLTQGQDIRHSSCTGTTSFTCGVVEIRRAVEFVPDVAGTYKVMVWLDSDADGSYDAGEKSSTVTMTTAGRPASVVLTKVSPGSPATTFTDAGSTSRNQGAMYSVIVRDANGVQTQMTSDESLGLASSISTTTFAKAGALSTDVTSLAHSDMQNDGKWYFHARSSASADSTPTITVTAQGGEIASGVSAITTVTFKAPTAGADFEAIDDGGATVYTTSGLDTAVPATDAFDARFGSSVSLRATGDTADEVLVAHVADTNGTLTGYYGGAFTMAATTAATTFYASFAVGGSSTAVGRGWIFTADDESAVSALTATVKASVATTTTISPSTVRAQSGSALTFTGTTVDQFGAAFAGASMSWSVSGTNATAVSTTKITDADGLTTFSYTPATTGSDSVSAGGTTSTAATVTLVSTLDIGSVLLTTPHTSATGVTEAAPTYSDIDAGAGGAQDGAVAVTATIKDAAGTLLAGVPVTFTVSGTGAAVRSDTKTVYTGTAGTATARVYGWVAGTYTVTATAGTKSDDAPINFAQNTPTEARNVSATVSGGLITVTVTDRFGNGVFEAPVYATRVGTGGFAGSSKTNSTTGRDGKVEFIFEGGSADVTLAVGTVITYGQTDATAGLVASTTATDVFDAVVAGTATAAEEGVGNTADYTKAGNNSTVVKVATTDAAAAAAEAASDAALEAIDAANAATDAANLAAEAADAATVAAEEARDAADAATAAVEALASEVATLIAGLKAQITTLANTVAKIAKRVRA